MDTSFTSDSVTRSHKNIPTEGKFTRQVENVTARIPSMGYLGLAAGSMILSVALQAFTKQKSWANFVGLWVPSFMLIGIYNKLVKLEGSDHRSHPNMQS